jgi:hypothetical protein
MTGRREFAFPANDRDNIPAFRDDARGQTD